LAGTGNFPHSSSETEKHNESNHPVAIKARVMAMPKMKLNSEAINTFIRILLIGRKTFFYADQLKSCKPHQCSLSPKPASIHSSMIPGAYEPINHFME
jgi:hypothetical protein